MLKRNLGLQNETDVSLHHIFPGNNIVDLMRKCISQVPGTVNLLNKHCNSYPQIKDKMVKFINANNWQSAMETCWSSIFWFKNNLVIGPKEDRRSDDPGSAIDKPILRNQNVIYRTVFETMTK